MCDTATNYKFEQYRQELIDIIKKAK